MRNIGDMRGLLRWKNHHDNTNAGEGMEVKRDFIEIATFESKPAIQYWKRFTLHNNAKELVGAHVEADQRLRLRKHDKAVRIEIGNVDVMVDRESLINILIGMRAIR